MLRRAPLAKCILTLVFLGVTASAFAQLSGAIFTTTMNGVASTRTTTHKVRCDRRVARWGPRTERAAERRGLPDGDYYFQVTDPSGKTLLSTDPVDEQAVPRHWRDHCPACLAQVITTTASTSTMARRPLNCARTTTRQTRAASTRPGSRRSSEFRGNPNLVDNPCRGGCFHGFVASSSKTDNFKVKGGAGGRA